MNNFIHIVLRHKNNVYCSRQSRLESVVVVNQLFVAVCKFHQLARASQLVFQGWHSSATSPHAKCLMLCRIWYSGMSLGFLNPKNIKHKRFRKQSWWLQVTLIDSKNRHRSHFGYMTKVQKAGWNCYFSYIMYIIYYYRYYREPFA